MIYYIFIRSETLSDHFQVGIYQAQKMQTHLCVMIKRSVQQDNSSEKGEE